MFTKTYPDDMNEGGKTCPLDKALLLDWDPGLEKGGRAEQQDTLLPSAAALKSYLCAAL